MYVLLSKYMNYVGPLKSSMYLLHEAVIAANTLLAMGPVPLGGKNSSNHIHLKETPFITIKSQNYPINLT